MNLQCNQCRHCEDRGQMDCSVLDHPIHNCAPLVLTDVFDNQPLPEPVDLLQRLTDSFTATERNDSNG